MKLIQISVTAAFIVSGAYFGLCVGQAVSFYAAAWFMREVANDQPCL